MKKTPVLNRTEIASLYSAGLDQVPDFVKLNTDLFYRCSRADVNFNDHLFWEDMIAIAGEVLGNDE
jgi:hypothetical protein